jgi:hypothetical protein
VDGVSDRLIICYHVIVARVGRRSEFKNAGFTGWLAFEFLGAGLKRRGLLRLGGARDRGEVVGVEVVSHLLSPHLVFVAEFANFLGE